MKPALRTTALAFALGMAFAAQSFAATLHMHNGGDVTSLDPHKVSGDWEHRVLGDMFEGLTTTAANGDTIPGMAESWEISDDGKVYTFTLREGIAWTDGEPVTADDFVFGFQRLMDPATAADYAYLQFPILNASEINDGSITDLGELGVKALDERTLEITLENATPYFLTALTHYTADPIPRHAVEAHGSDWVKIGNIVTNAAYTPTEWVPGSHVRSVKNPDYYDADNVQIEEVVYYTLEDESAALKAYRAGEFDILTDFPGDQFEWMQENLPGEARVKPFAGLYYYVINNEMFGEPVRQALSMAINREVIGPGVLGTGEIPAYSWVPPGMANYVDSPYEVSWKDTPYGERVAQAKELLAGEGYGPDNPLEVTLRYNTNDNHKRVAVAIAAMWKPLGVEVELYNAEVKVHYADLKKGDLEIARAGWLADYNDPQNFLDLLRCSNPEFNYGRYCNEEYDALMDRAIEETDLGERAKLMYEAEKMAMEDHGAMPIYYYLSENVVSPKIGGFEDNAFDVHRVRFMTKSE